MATQETNAPAGGIGINKTRRAHNNPVALLKPNYAYLS
jgi:hypothetical protein